MPSDARTVLPTTARARAAEIVEDVISNARTRADRGIAKVRLVVSAAILVTWPIGSYEDLSAGDMRAVIPIVAGAAGAISALFFLWVYKRTAARNSHVVISVFTDALLTVSALAPYVFWPDKEYTSVFQLAGVYIILVSHSASGARLSRREVVVSTLAHMGPMVVFFVYEIAVGIRRDHGHTDTAIFFAAAVATTALAWWVCRHARVLVVEGAASATNAERARHLLGAYADDGVAQHLLSSDEIHLGGETREVAILFSDLRGFTTWAEGLPPDEILHDLNAYLDAMVRVIKAEGGTIDKFVGDAIMAVFGAPVFLEDAAARAIRAARAMEDALVTHNATRAARGRPAFRQGIGVHFGSVVVGNLGCEGRVDYTVIGDTVNVASRLESATKDAGVSVLISDDAARSAGATGLDEVAALSVKGRNQPVKALTFATNSESKSAAPSSPPR